MEEARREVEALVAGALGERVVQRPIGHSTRVPDALPEVARLGALVLLLHGDGRLLAERSVKCLFIAAASPRLAHLEAHLGRGALSEGGRGGGGRVARVLQRLGAEPHEDGARRPVGEHEAAAAAQRPDAAAHLQQVGLLLPLAAHDEQAPRTVLVVGRLAALPAVHRHAPWSG